jgi:L-cystine uptake protein TcyP (sodium:dicarboxylate symporter family)
MMSQSKVTILKFCPFEVNCMLCKFTSSSSVSSYLKLGCQPKYHAMCAASSFWGWLLMEMLLNPISNFGFK